MNDNKGQIKNADWMEDLPAGRQDYEGQLAVDVYQNEDSLTVKAPIAGVRPEDLELSITDDTITIKGERRENQEIQRENYLAQECYWGAFSRSYVLPIPVMSEKAQANLKNGILTVTIPKQEKTQSRKIEINTE